MSLRLPPSASRWLVALAVSLCVSSVSAQDNRGALSTSSDGLRSGLPDGTPSNTRPADAGPPGYIPGQPMPKEDAGEEPAKGGNGKQGAAGNERIIGITRSDRNSRSATNDAAPRPDAADIYSGVIPGDRDWLRRDERQRDRPRRTNRMSWIGFRPGKDNAGSSVFVQTLDAASFEVLASEEPLKLRILLKDTRVPRRNDRRSLDTRFWPTAVVDVRAVQRRRDVELIITLQGAAEYTMRQEGAFLFINFNDAGFSSPASNL